MWLRTLFRAGPHKVWLGIDPPPDKSWLYCRKHESFFTMLLKGQVSEVSIPYDLSETESGVLVIHWMTEQILLGKLKKPPKIQCRTATPEQGRQMSYALRTMYKRWLRARSIT